MSTAAAPLPSGAGLRFNSCTGVASLAREPRSICRLAGHCPPGRRVSQRRLYVASREARQL